MQPQPSDDEFWRRKTHHEQTACHDVSEVKERTHNCGMKNPIKDGWRWIKVQQEKWRRKKRHSSGEWYHDTCRILV